MGLTDLLSMVVVGSFSFWCGEGKSYAVLIALAARRFFSGLVLS